MSQNNEAASPLAEPPPLSAPAPPTPPVQTPLEGLKPLAATGWVGGEKIITNGVIILDPDQTVFMLKWGSVNINFSVHQGQPDTKSTINSSEKNLDIALKLPTSASSYVKFKNCLRYGQNDTHLAIFAQAQSDIERPALLITYTISSTSSRLP